MKQTILGIVLACTACTSPADELLGETSQDGISFNGLSLNGVSFNGISFNGTSLAGASLAGVGVAGVSSKGLPLVATSVLGPPLTGSALVGSSWTGVTYEGTQVKLRIDAASVGAAPNTDLWFYRTSYQTTSGWHPLCGLDAANQPIEAVSVAGVWRQLPGDLANYGPSATQFSLACRGKTIAKCVELGYKPYRGYAEQLASCVRLLRADFCGSGVSYTVDGNVLNLYDSVGVQGDVAQWTPEAEWTPSGASCVNSHNAARFDLVVSRDPRCIEHDETPTCGTSFANGAVLIDELSPTVVTQIQAAQTAQTTQTTWSR
jgi:hypothetical protein